MIVLGDHNQGEGSNSKGYAIILNESNPYTKDGITEQYIRIRCKTLEERGTEVIILFPLDSILISEIKTQKDGWNVIKNHCYHGIKTPQEIKDIVSSLEQECFCVGVYLFSLSDENVARISSIIDPIKIIKPNTELIHESETINDSEYRKSYQPELSAIIPIYNTSESTLNRMFDSIQKQGKSENTYEVILIDDGSEKACAEHLESIKQQHKNIRLIHIPNGGVSNARNVGIRIAQGIYITFIDADDYLADGFFNNALEIAWKKKADVIYGGIEFVPPVFTVQKQNNETLDYVNGAEIQDLKCCLLNYPRGRFKYSIFGSPCGRLFKLEKVSRVEFHTDIKYYEDQIFNREVINCCNTAVSTPYTWYYYVQNDLSATHYTKKHDDFFAENKRFFDTLYELNRRESDYIRDIARIANMNHYGAIVLNGYIFSKRPWRITRKQMAEGMNHPLMKETIQNMNKSWKYMNFLEKTQFFLYKHRMYLLIFWGLKLLYRSNQNKGI